MMPASSPAPPDLLAAFQAAAARVPAMRFDVRYFASAGSTMDLAERAVQGGASEGLVLVADEQTEGRGRRGRTWSSPPGAGLYLSIVLRPIVAHFAAPTLALLTLAAGVAVRTAIVRATGLAADLKWPNDLVVARRKLAGILAEGLNVGTPAQTVVLGIGVNVLASAHPGEIAMRATSLEDELGRAVDRALVFEELLVALADTYDLLRRGGTDDILRAWREAAPAAVGATVEWTAIEGRRRGVTAGVDGGGALLVRTAAGVERIAAGEVTWL